MAWWCQCYLYFFCISGWSIHVQSCIGCGLEFEVNFGRFSGGRLRGTRSRFFLKPGFCFFSKRGSRFFQKPSVKVCTHGVVQFAFGTEVCNSMELGYRFRRL